MNKKKNISEYKKLTGIARRLIYLKLKNQRLKSILTKKNELLEKKEDELKIYINKFLENEQRWAAVNYINKNINATLTMESIYEFINVELANLLDVDYCAVCTIDDVCGQYVLQRQDNTDCTRYLKSFLFENFCLENGAEVEKSTLGAIFNNNLNKSYKALTLMNKTKVFGMIFIHKDAEAITEEHMKVLDMAADSISMALLNSYWFSKMKMSNNRKLEFLAHLTHEFKTPLNAINGFTSLMYNEELPRERQKKFHKNILNASKHLLQVAEYTMEMARAETDKLRLSYEEFKPKEVIQEVLAILDERRNSRKINLSQHLDDVLVTADKRRFKQLIFNLVGNAIKFSHENGHVKVCSCLRNDKYYFEVRDNGEGIDPTEQDKIFEFFTHLNTNKFENEDGSGVGLSLCKKIITLHNGGINFTSELHKGSVFWFNLPLDVNVKDEVCY